MKVITQNVSKANLTVNEKPAGKISKGLVIFIGIETKDTKNEIDWMISKILNLKLFRQNKSFDKAEESIVDIKGSIMVISQFTICADTKKGTKPSFSNAMEPKNAKELYTYFVDKLTKLSDLNVISGEFGSYMEVELINEGPYTIILEK